MFPYNGQIKDMYIDGLILSNLLTPKTFSKDQSLKQICIEDKNSKELMKIYAQNTAKLLIKTQNSELSFVMFALSTAYFFLFIIPFLMRVICIHMWLKDTTNSHFMNFTTER